MLGCAARLLVENRLAGRRFRRCEREGIAIPPVVDLYAQIIAEVPSTDDLKRGSILGLVERNIRGLRGDMSLAVGRNSRNTSQGSCKIRRLSNKRNRETNKDQQNRQYRSACQISPLVSLAKACIRSLSTSDQLLSRFSTSARDRVFAWVQNRIAKDEGCGEQILIGPRISFPICGLIRQISAVASMLWLQETVISK